MTRKQLEALQLKHGPGEVNELVNSYFEMARALSEAQPGDASRANVDDDDDWWYGVWREACELSSERGGS